MKKNDTKSCPYCGNSCTKDELAICEIDGCSDTICHECQGTHISVAHTDLTRELEDEEWNEL